MYCNFLYHNATFDIGLWQPIFHCLTIPVRKPRARAIRKHALPPSADSLFIQSTYRNSYHIHPSIQIENGDRGGEAGVQCAVTEGRRNVERGPPHQRLQEGLRQEQAHSGV